VPLDEYGEATSTTIEPLMLTVGINHFRAVYEGDDNYTGSESGDTAEPLIVEPIPTTTATELSSGSITLTETITDQVTIGTTATGTLPSASGTWTVEASMDPTFASGVVPVDSDSVSGSLPFIVSTDAWAPASAGTWYFRATYSGDTNYDGSHSDPYDEMLIVDEPV